MSLSKRKRPVKSVFRTLTVVGIAAVLGFASACTVRPLLSSEPGSAGQETAADLSSVEVTPVGTREALEVRNQLIFLFQGGGAQPADPRYRLDLAVARSVGSAAEIQRGRENEPTAGTVTLTGDYRLSDRSGQLLAQGRRQVSASFDRPRQEFAVMRAQRDAEDRAARELAELIHLSVAQDLARMDVR